MEPLVAGHALAAAFVLALGAVQVLRPRRDVAHRLIGRAWVGVMALTCVSSFWIRPHGFSWLHGLAAFTLFSVTAGVVAIRRGDVRAHRGHMRGSYAGTVVAFLFAAFLPDRAIARMALSDPLDLVLAVTLIGAVAAVIVAGALSRATTHPTPGSSSSAGRFVVTEPGARPAPAGRPNSARMASTSTSPGSPPSA